MNKIKKMATDLQLPNLKLNYEDLINIALNNKSSYEEFLENVLSSEIDLRKQNSIKNKIKNARFPYVRTFEELDFEFFPSNISNKIRELQSLNFIEQGHNVILVGNPGVGKTHTAIATGLKTCFSGKNVLYITVPNLITELKESMNLNQLNNYKKKFIKYDLVILDELGYITFDKQGSELLFNLLSLRNESKSIIITTNLSFNRWNEIFNDSVLTAAMVDRLTHKAHVLNIQGDSYRMKETIEWMDTNKS
ncbi:MAG: IS21-like element helper ATPase IstB [Peptostreptococcaceae bacterium]